MSLLLTTPINPGDLDTSPYTHIKVMSFRLDQESKSIELTCRAGRIVESVFVPGKAYTPKNFLVSDTDYTTMLAALPAETETIYNAAARVLYQWLIDNGHYSGSIE